MKTLFAHIVATTIVVICLTVFGWVLSNDTASEIFAWIASFASVIGISFTMFFLYCVIVGKIEEELSDLYNTTTEGDNNAD